MSCARHGPACRATLEAGRYFGARTKRFVSRDVLASEVLHEGARELPQHDHALAYFCMLVDGHYAEESQGRALDYATYEVGFHPARTPHRDRVGREGGRFLCMEIGPGLIGDGEIRMRRHLHALPGSVSLQMLRALRALRAGTLSELDLESVAWELCGEASLDRAIPERSAAPWLARLLAILEETSSEPITVRQLAHELGLHPVHVAREFRRRHQLTIGEYVNQLRVRGACRAIRRGRDSLSDVAHSVGFSDHAHFCRVFRRSIGCTPSAFAAAIRA